MNRSDYEDVARAARQSFARYVLVPIGILSATTLIMLAGIAWVATHPETNASTEGNGFVRVIVPDGFVNLTLPGDVSGEESEESHNVFGAIGDHEPSDHEPIAVPQLTIPCEVVRAIDGDTVVLRSMVVFHGRLLNCWSADGTENDHKARDWMDGFRGKRVMVTVPIPMGDLSKAQTMNRLLVNINAPSESPDGGTINFSTEIVKNGWATARKPKAKPSDK